MPIKDVTPLSASKGDAPILVLDVSGNFSRDVVRCLAAAGCNRIHVLAPRTSPTQFCRFTHFHVLRDKKQTDLSLMDAVTSIRWLTGVNTLLAVDEDAVAFVARNRSKLSRIWELGLTPAIEAFKIAVDKSKLSRHLTIFGLPQPHTVVEYSREGVLAASALVGFPLLLKPIRSPGSGAGIRRADTMAELCTILESGVPRAGVLVQAYLQGRDIDCSVLCRNGEILAYTIQQPLIPPEKPYAAANAVEFVHDADVLTVIRRLMASLYFSGVAHVDMRRCTGERQPRILEINARFWGSVIASCAADVNFPHLACKLARGEEAAFADYRQIAFVPWKQLIASWLRGRPVWLKDLHRLRTGIRYVLSDPVFIVRTQVAKYLRGSARIMRGLISRPVAQRSNID